MDRACSTCRVPKPISKDFFYPDHRRVPPFQSRCKACTLTAMREKSGGVCAAERTRRRAAAIQSPTRTCRKCQTEKPNTPDFFYRDARRPAGALHSRCIACEAAYGREFGKATYAARGGRTTEQKARQARVMLEWRKRNPQQSKAYQAVAHAIRSGKLPREACRKCATPNAQAHHSHGYAPENWLRVEWLCRGCHMVEHRTR